MANQEQQHPLPPHLPLLSKITGLLAKIWSDVLFLITLKLLWMYIFGGAVDSGRMDWSALLVLLLQAYLVN